MGEGDAVAAAWHAARRAFPVRSRRLSLEQDHNSCCRRCSGVVSIEQNNIIKIFSVAAVGLMPPTLIASIYGMNFKHMPELDWQLGYPIAIVLMVLAAALPYYFFKWKKWLVQFICPPSSSPINQLFFRVVGFRRLEPTVEGSRAPTRAARQHQRINGQRSLRPRGPA